MRNLKSNKIYSIQIGFVIAIMFLVIDFQTASSQVKWSPIGPGGGGWLTSIAVANNSENTVYVGCDVGGIYKSTDHGNTWEIKNKGLNNYFIQDIAIDSDNANVLFVATQGGVFKSVDSGDNWEIKRAGFPPVAEYNFSAPVNSVVVDPNNSNIIYAGIGVSKGGYDFDMYHWESADVKGAIYKSTDYGENWVLIFNKGIDTTAMIYSMAIDPKNSNTIYAATDKGIYKSISAGANWTPINSGLPHNKTMKLIIDPINTDTLYVTLWAEPGSAEWQGGVYKSVNGGEQWSAKNSGLPNVVGDESGLTCNYPSLVIDKNNPQILYVGNIPWTPNPGVYKTVDGGDNWTWVSRQESPHKNLDKGWIIEAETSAMCMAIDPNNSGTLYFGTSMHLFKTEDAGGNWNQTFSKEMGAGYWQGNGFETTCVQKITVDPTNSEIIYAGYWDIGLFKSVDGGATFKKAVTGMDYNANTFDIVVDPDNPAIVYAASGWWEENKGAVYKSSDYGENWIALQNGLPDAQVWSIAVDKNSPQNSRTLYAASFNNGIYKTTDGGKNWFQANNGLGVSNNLKIRKICIDPNNSEILYVGIESKVIENGDDLKTIHGGLFKSINGGTNWTRIDSDNPQISVWDIKILPTNSNIIYTAVCSEYDHTLKTYFYGGVYKSTNGGTSWTRKNTGFGEMTNLDVSSIELNPAEENTIYAVTRDYPYHDESSGRGIFKSKNGGDNWLPENDGLGVLYFSAITVDPSNNKILYAGSAGNGIQKGVDSDILDLIENRQSSLSSSFNTPNPFSSSTEIHFVLPSSGEVNLTVFDIHGRLICTLLHNQYYETGSYKVVWKGLDDNLKQIKSGLYFYHLSSGTRSFTGKMIYNK